MKSVWHWIVVILVGVVVICLIAFGRSERQAYRIAKGAVSARVNTSQEKIDTAVEMASASVDYALQLAGDLPSQQAKADLVKQDIEEIGNRLSQAAEARGDAAIERLDAAIEQFNKTLDTIDEASKEATDPEAKAKLDRIYGALEAARDQIVQKVLSTQ